MKRTTLIFAALFTAFFANACKKTEPMLSLLVWEGYADTSFVHNFEVTHHCKVVASYMGSSDELVAKLRGGSAANYDVISPSSDVAASIVKAGLAAPLDLSRLPSYLQLSARLRDSSLVKANAQVYGVPFMWGPNPLLYDASAFSQAPDSWNVLWDPKYRGKVSLWDELSSIYMAAQILDYDKPANPGAAEYLTRDEKKSLHLDEPDAYMLKIYFWQDVPRRAKYNEIWNEVKAAQ